MKKHNFDVTKCPDVNQELWDLAKEIDNLYKLMDYLNSLPICERRDSLLGHVTQLLSTAIVMKLGNDGVLYPSVKEDLSPPKTFFGKCAL